MTPEQSAALLLRNVRYLLLIAILLALAEGLFSTSSGWDIVQGMLLIVAVRFTETAMRFFPRVTRPAGIPTASFFQIDPNPPPSDQRDERTP